MSHCLQKMIIEDLLSVSHLQLKAFFQYTWYIVPLFSLNIFHSYEYICKSFHWSAY